MAASELTGLDEQLCFALYTASRAMAAVHRPLLESVGITYPQYLVMLVLWEQGAVTVGRLGRAVQLETGTLSPLLKRLEGAGLITRIRQVEDERSVLVGLTPAGDALRSVAVDIQRRITEATGLGPGEVAELRATLNGLTARLRAAATRPS